MQPPSIRISQSYCFPLSHVHCDKLSSLRWNHVQVVAKVTLQKKIGKRKKKADYHF